MGVIGAGLKANGLHKSYMNGSPEQHNSASQKAHVKPSGPAVPTSSPAIPSTMPKAKGC